ncbi:hypothetical protein LMG28614_00713 [Paraburkholderia ultramafica]|uniref:Uncharacterized protein n=1 Tax=Paraburkholderia ultramafica TaxID=1544867 RepID=A0A6S7AUX6_9BURK|nr:carboxypeptidase-like regulatory domain-containing protein [Paraburkholderia ultramafica]CAB3778748.1 hypothetical protein LMG28614_00713 [Paraburkholderia ultramafica]
MIPAIFGRGALDSIRRVYSPIGFRPIDELTGDTPLGNVTCSLFLEEAPGIWRLTDLRPVQSVSGVLTFPGLGRSAVVAGGLPRHYRADLDAEFYLPFYAAQSDGIEFDVFPFNDDNPPAQFSKIPQTVVLVPAPSYPFPAHLRVLRGVVRDAAGPVANVEVVRGNTERVLSDAQGSYALPLRLTPDNVPATIDAIDHRANRHGQITITLPADLGKNNPITIA